jgi:hypothetical protein
MLNSLMILVLVGAAIVFAQVSKDAILSRISYTTPGKLDRSFFIHLATAGGLPRTTVVVSQFPAVSRFLFSWIEPTRQALK